jgi:hypothetical protein
LWLFPKIKYALKRPRFQNVENIKKECDDGAESYSTIRFPKKFPSAADSKGDFPCKL